MSNNPFRRSQLVRPSDPLPPVDIPQHVELDARPVTPPKRSKQKRVQIQTPPHSPETPFLAEDGNRRLSASSGRTNSPPPPPGTIAGDDSASDSSVAAEPALEQARVNARRNSATLDPPPSTIPPPQSAARAPYNPFARTLATSEASLGLHRGGLEEQEQASSEQSRASSRPAMDVDMFKNILLTGSAPPPSATGAASAPPPVRSQGSSAGTDASSVSRQSLFDSGGEYRSESPRTSFDDFASASSDEEGRAHDNASLMGPDRPQELAPPAPPKPKARGPQTVSFAEFDQSIPSHQYESVASRTPTTRSTSDISQPSPQDWERDLNKPLPAPPSKSEKGPVTTFPSVERSSPPGDPAQPKKVPPPPPTSRRRAAGLRRSRRHPNPAQDLATTVTGEEDSDSEDYDSDPDSDSDAAGSFVKVAPPPPPARKSQPHSHSPSTFTSSVNRPLSTDVSKAMPPPPPRRQPSRSGSHASGGSNRPSFESSRPAAVLREQASSSTGLSAPPVPPPRRGAATSSKRESLDGAAPPSLRSASIESGSRRRVSAQSAESPRAGSLAAPATATATAIANPNAVPPSLPAAQSSSSSPSPSSSVLAREKVSASNAAVELPDRDLLADLTAFQAEIDALRAKAGSSA